MFTTHLAILILLCVCADETPSQRGSNLNISPGADSVFVPDFTLFCIEKTIYMKVTRQLYLKAIQTTAIEKHRTSSFNKSLSGVPSGEFSESDTMSTKQDKLSVNPILESSQIARYRKISMSTNLPDYNLFQSLDAPEKTVDAVDLSRSNEQRRSNRQMNLLLDSSTVDMPKRKSSPLESMLKRSDAVEQAPDDTGSARSPSSCSVGEDIKLTVLNATNRKSVDSQQSAEQAESKVTSRNGSLKQVLIDPNTTTTKPTTEPADRADDRQIHDEMTHLINHLAHPS